MDPLILSQASARFRSGVRPGRNAGTVIPGVLNAAQFRAVVDAAASDGVGPAPRELVWSLVAPRGGRVLPLCRVVEASGSVLPVSNEDTRTSVAGATPYGTEANEASVAFVSTDSLPKRYAVWIPAHRSVLADAGMAEEALRQLIEDELVSVMDRDLINGPGGDSFTGVLQTSGIQTRNKGADSHAVALVRACLDVHAKDWPQPVIVLNPADADDVLLAADFDLQLFQTVGARFVFSTHVPATKAIVGDFRALTVAIRSDVSVTVDDDHANFWVEGKVALLGEVRADAIVTQPEAFVAVDFAA